MDNGCIYRSGAEILKQEILICLIALHIHEAIFSYPFSFIFYVLMYDISSV